MLRNAVSRFPGDKAKWGPFSDLSWTRCYVVGHGPGLQPLHNTYQNFSICKVGLPRRVRLLPRLVVVEVEAAPLVQVVAVSAPVVVVELLPWESNVVEQTCCDILLHPGVMVSGSNISYL
jgi:hypothetical protein